MKLLFFLLKLINSLIPKSTNKILFISRPDFSDNTLHMYKYFKKKEKHKQLSWLIYDKPVYNLLVDKGYTNIFYLNSARGIWEYLRSKIIISSSSSLWQIKSPFQKQFDLWHGIPLKNILNMEKTIKNQQKQAPNITMRFATSNLVKAQLAASFEYNASKIIVTGQPRTDALFSTDKHLSDLIKKDISKFSKIACYMPTYRVGYKDKQDGLSFDITNIFRMEEYNHQQFLDFLKLHNILFLLKLHPYEEKLYQDIDLGENIQWITNTLLAEQSLDIYDILPEVDILLTDYSSVYFDFLLLNRKIIFLPVDLQEYRKKRGFQLEPYEFWTPGEKVYDQNNLQTALIRKESKEERDHRVTIRNIMFTYQDAYSSKRIYNEISNYIEY
jgi:CDP-glycerol glycerophosphotransferase (TagB/SpsB family)